MITKPIPIIPILIKLLIIIEAHLIIARSKLSTLAMFIILLSMLLIEVNLTMIFCIAKVYLFIL